MFENKNFQSWFKENTPKEGLSETTTFSKQFVKDAWDNGYYVGYNKAKEEGKVVVEHFEAYGQCRDSRRIAILEAENAELKDKLSNLASVAEVRLANWQKYEKENAELKTQAKKIILKLYNVGRDVLMCRADEAAYDNLSTAINDRSIEQFLKEN